MKRFLLIGLIIGLVLIVIGGAGVVYARVTNSNNPVYVTSQTLPNGDKVVQQFGYGPGGMMGGQGNGYGPGGMMGEQGYGYGPGGMMGRRGGRAIYGMGILHNYMVSAFANAVGLTVDDVNTRLSNGETPQQIALAQGKTEADLPALWKQVHQDALNQAVKDGAITQAQADRMLQMMNNSTGPGFGFGDCPMWDGDEAQP
jgi:hypothetical protein